MSYLKACDSLTAPIPLQNKQEMQRLMQMIHIQPTLKPLSYDVNQSIWFTDDTMKRWRLVKYHRDISEAQQGAQIALFRKQLLLAMELQKPMVIHCRDLVDSRAEIDFLAIMKAVVPCFHRIHCHCFKGSLHQMWSWKRYFPNTVFGFAGALLRQGFLLVPVIRALTLSHMVLESDAPYLIPPNLKGGHTESEPWMVRELAKRLAHIKDLPLATVLKETALTASHFYDLGLE
ncbi:hypothetical protein CAPTEDRAFT_192743 [Capitella teleta]|uniref:TatD DNase family protein n=1 Tax=Capitella teleta TaxID=283909 RepID=R7TCK6_CAPTE|nr:hypothetical protein CAPTEDRAFT_192743 [Capitella teleta]|eukprot:ELT88796.1 hypothetical protein CAPTEDRAFT_192743 [Capitella teleta]